MKEIRAAIYSTLSGNATITSETGGTAVYYGVAPQEKARPYVIFFNAGGGPENYYSGELTSERYLIKGVADSLDKALDIDAACRAAIHKQALTVSGYTNIWTRRETEVSTTEVLEDGRVVWHEGGYYRIRIDA